MFDDPEIAAAIARAAGRNGADAAALRDALLRESAAELASALGIGLPEAGERMERALRVLAFGGDWGAGCRLLSDDVRAELLAVLERW